MPWQGNDCPHQAEPRGACRRSLTRPAWGDPVLDALQRNSGVFEGYQFTSRSKQMLMEGLAVAIQRKQISVLDGVMVNELEAFEYEYTATGVRYGVQRGQSR